MEKRLCSDLPGIRVHPTDHLPLRPLQHPKVLRSGDDHPLRAPTGRHSKFIKSISSSWDPSFLHSLICCSQLIFWYIHHMNTCAPGKVSNKKYNRNYIFKQNRARIWSRIFSVMTCRMFCVVSTFSGNFISGPLIPQGERRTIWFWAQNMFPFPDSIQKNWILNWKMVIGHFIGLICSWPCIHQL